MTMSPLISAMIAAAHAAGEGLIADRERIATLTIHSKAGAADMFTEADLKAEATVRERLMAHAPDYGFLGEEGGLTPGRDADHVWVVDPLDGTTNFLTGSPLFAVNIALTRQGEVIAGVTHVPAMNEIFWAETGSGAWLKPGTAVGTTSSGASSTIRVPLIVMSAVQVPAMVCMSGMLKLHHHQAKRHSDGLPKPVTPESDASVASGR